MKIAEGEYMFCDDKTNLSSDSLHNLLMQSHWAKHRPIEIIDMLIKNSLCFSIYHDDILVGFARVISDYTVYTLILDVIIDKRYRGKGLGKKLVDFIINHPEIKNTNHVLWTKYADKLYSKYDFKEEDCYTLMFKRKKINISQ